MPYICPDPERWEKEYAKKLVPNGQCVALVKKACHTPPSSLWKEGDPVQGNLKVARGTAIATFINGTYPNLESGNHAAIYLGQDKSGITVLDQWKTKGKVSRRTICFKHKGSVFRVNDGTAYSVVE